MQNDSYWLIASIFSALAGAVICKSRGDHVQARIFHLTFSFLSAVLASIAWLVFENSPSLHHSFGIGLDSVGGAMMVLSSFLYYVVPLATQKTKFRRVPTAATLMSQAINVALFSFYDNRLLILCLALSIIPVLFELKARKESARIFVFYMVLMILMIGSSYYFLSADRHSENQETLALYILACGILIRCGCFPLHSWIPDLVSKLSFGTGLLQTTPLIGIYLMVRLVLPIASTDLLHNIGYLLMASVIYAAGLTLVQVEARKFFSFTFIGLSGLAMLGIIVPTRLGVAAGLCLWLSLSTALTGFGLTIRALESRVGRIRLDQFHGLYDQVPMFAVFFLITGLASVGFPGTVGFAGIELLLESMAESYPGIGLIIVLGAALYGIAIMFAYFRMFTGKHHVSIISLTARGNEKAAILALTSLILACGILPDPFVKTRLNAVEAILSSEKAANPAPENIQQPGDHH